MSPRSILFQRHQAGPAGERGVAIAEFALLLPVLFAVLFGIVEFGRAFNAELVLSHAAREGARELALSDDAAQAAAVAEASAAPLPAAELGITPSPCSTPGTPASVTITYDFEVFVPLVYEGTIEMSSTAVMRCE